MGKFNSLTSNLEKTTTTKKAGNNTCIDWPFRGLAQTRWETVLGNHQTTL